MHLLTRLVKDNPNIEGITIGDHEFKIRHFADDTFGILKNDTSYNEFNKEANTFFKASAMSENFTKRDNIAKRIRRALASGQRARAAQEAPQEGGRRPGRRGQGRGGGEAAAAQRHHLRRAHAACPSGEAKGALREIRPGHRGGCIDQSMDEWTDGCINGRMDGSMGGYMDGRMDGWID